MAGGTGRLGARIVRQLLSQGLKCAQMPSRLPSMLHDGTRCCCTYLWQLQTCAIALWHQYMPGHRDQLRQIPHRVRAGVRDVEQAQSYIATAVAYGLLPRDAARKIALTEYDITDPDTIPAAIGNAAKVRV